MTPLPPQGAHPHSRLSKSYLTSGVEACRPPTRCRAAEMLVTFRGRGPRTAIEVAQLIKLLKASVWSLEQLPQTRCGLRCQLSPSVDGIHLSQPQEVRESTALRLPACESVKDDFLTSGIVLPRQILYVVIAPSSEVSNKTAKNV